jgi:ethanolamine ammonia-lyase small subunit
MDSLGVYLTWAPRVGRTDAERNCISNVRPAGLPPAEAARKLLWLLGEARRLGATGVRLKEDFPPPLCMLPPPHAGEGRGGSSSGEVAAPLEPPP